MAKARVHTIEQLRAAFRYDPASGNFYWLCRTSLSIRVGDVAGSHRGGVGVKYRRLRYDGVEYEAHRVAWLFMTGEWPSALIDHRDMNKSNNAWGNLREATPMLNNANAPGHGQYPKGVTLHRTGRFQAQIKARGKNYYLGLHDTPEQANAAYAAKAVELFGEFARAA